MSETRNDKQWRILDKGEHTCCWDATIIDEEDRMIVECDKITAAFIVWNIEKIKELEKRIAFALSDEGTIAAGDALDIAIRKAQDEGQYTEWGFDIPEMREAIRAALQVDQ